MVKNVIIPFILILLTGGVTIYCWFEEAPFSFVGLVGIITLWLGSMYISYYIAYAVFPNKYNIPLPPVSQLMELKNRTGPMTRGGIWGTVFSLVFAVGGTYGLVKLADQYKRFQIDEYGKQTKAIVVTTGFKKGIGEYAEYEFRDAKGKVYEDKCSRGILVVGDTVEVIYSTQRPIINLVLASTLRPSE